MCVVMSGVFTTAALVTQSLNQKRDVTSLCESLPSKDLADLKSCNVTSYRHDSNDTFFVYIVTYVYVA